MDKRILEWFDEQVTEAIRKHHDGVAEFREQQLEGDERRELARLKAKYEGTP